MSEPILLFLSPISRIPECFKSLNTGITIACHSVSFDLRHVVLGRPSRRGRFRGVVGVHLERASPGMVGRAEGVGVGGNGSGTDRGSPYSYGLQNIATPPPSPASSGSRGSVAWRHTQGTAYGQPVLRAEAVVALY